MRAIKFVVVLMGLFLAPVLKSQNPEIYSLIVSDTITQYIVKYDLVTQHNDTVFQLPDVSVCQFGGSGGCASDLYNKRYFFTSGYTDSLFTFSVDHSQVTGRTKIQGAQLNSRSVCGSIEYDQFLNSIIWMSTDWTIPDQLQVYQIDSDNVKTYTLPSIGQNHSCGYCPTAYNMINQQILSMPIYYSSSLHWVVVDVPSQQVLINTEMPDSNYFAYLVSSPITGKYYGCRFNSFYVQGIFEIDPFNLTAVKIADFPNDYNGGYNDEYGMVDVATNKYIFPYYSINHENKLGICNLNDFTIQTILFPGGPDRNQLFNRPQNANMVYRNGKLFVTKGENYNWYLNDNIIQNTTVNYFTPTQSGYYKSEVLIGKAIYYTDSLYIDLTGIKEEYQTTFSLLPNPATNQLTVTLNQTAQNATLQILSIEGKQLTGTIPVTPQSTTVDVSTLPKGLYFIVLQDEKGKAVKKFVKE